MPAHAVGTWTPGRADVAPPRLSSIAAMYLCWPALLRAISGALSTRPQRRRSLAGFKEVSYYHRVTPCGLSNRARRTRSWRGCLRDGRQRWGRCIQATRTLVSESGLCSHRCVHGPVDPVLPRVAPALAWTLNKYTPAKECRPAEAIAVTGWGAPHQP